MQSAELKMDFMVRPWDSVIEISNQIPMESWMLVGGLMTQAHAMLAGYESRATHDIDVLIDVMASVSNVSCVVKKLQEMGFELQEPGLRGAAFHRMRRDSLIADVLVADHLPKGRIGSAKVNKWPMMEITGGAQAISRKMELVIEHGGDKSKVLIPNLLGALVLKSAAYCADRRDRHRHLDDVALLSSLVTNHKAVLGELHGSDRRRLRVAAEALSDPSDSSWLKLNPENRKAGQMTLGILSA